jgi:hypothetical protein
MLKAGSLGIVVLVLAQGLWFGSLLGGAYTELLVLLLWISPFIAALVTAYLSPGRKMVMGMSMAVIAAVLVVVLNAAFQAAGNAVDFPGAKGGLTLFVMTLMYSAVGAFLGSVTGQWLTRKRRNEREDVQL